MERIYHDVVIHDDVIHANGQRMTLNFCLGKRLGTVTRLLSATVSAGSLFDSIQNVLFNLCGAHTINSFPAKF